MISNEYVAGLFDGEGYVGVSLNPVHGTWKFQVTITNNYLPVLEGIQRVFGGSLVQPKHADDGREGKSSWTWNTYSKNAKNFLRAIEPHSIIKRRQIELALQYPLGSCGKGLTEGVKQKRHEILVALQEAKRETYLEARGVDLAGRDVLEEREDVQEAARLYQSGMSAADVASTLNVDLNTLYYWMRCLGINRSRVEAGKQAGETRKDAVHQRPDAQEAKTLYLSGMSAASVARHLEKKPATVNYWLRKMGITRSLKEAQKLRRSRSKELKL